MRTRDTSPIYSRREAEARNEAAGRHFFEAGALRFFNSRIGENFFPCEVKKCSYFVTSERNRGWGGNFPRLYTVRAIDWESGEVRTIGEFQAYQTHGVAQRRAKGYASGGYVEPKEAA